jgi:hypothetical protein
MSDETIAGSLVFVRQAGVPSLTIFPDEPGQVILHGDGRIEHNAEKLDDAAKAFWMAVKNMSPVPALVAERDELKEKLDRCERKHAVAIRLLEGVDAPVSDRFRLPHNWRAEIETLKPQ